MAEASEGLSHDYLREAIPELRQGGLEEAVGMPHRMKKLLEEPTPTVPATVTEPEAKPG
jgi:hypothetical protein